MEAILQGLDQQMSTMAAGPGRTQLKKLADYLRRAGDGLQDLEPLAGEMSGQQLGAFVIQPEDDMAFGQLSKLLKGIDAANLTPGLQNFRQNIIDETALRRATLNYSNLKSAQTAALSWLGGAADALPAPDTSTDGKSDTAAYIGKAVSGLNQELGKTSALSNSFKSIVSELKRMQGFVVDPATGAKASDKVLAWMLNGQPTEGNQGGLSYRGQDNLTFSDAANQAAQDTTDKLATFLESAADGVDTVQDAQRAREAAEQLQQVFNIIGMVGGAASGIAGIGSMINGLGKAGAKFTMSEAIEKIGKVGEKLEKGGRLGSSHAPEIAGIFNGTGAGGDKGAATAAAATTSTLSSINPADTMRNILQSTVAGDIPPSTTQSLDRVDKAFDKFVTKIAKNRDRFPALDSPFVVARGAGDVQRSAGDLKSPGPKFSVKGADGVSADYLMKAVEINAQGNPVYSIVDSQGKEVSRGTAETDRFGWQRMVANLPGAGKVMVSTTRDSNGRENLVTVEDLA